MLVFAGMTVLGVDIARTAFIASEAQAVADAASLAGLRALASVQSNNGGNVQSDAVTVAAANTMDGLPSPMVVSDVECGTWDFAGGSFSAVACPGAPDPAINAVRATANKQVTNFLAGVLGSPTSTLSRLATAALSAPSSGRPAMPLAVGDCYFDDYIQSGGNCSDLPALIQVPDGVDNSCWTSLTNSDPTNPNTLVQYLPPSCSAGGHTGGDVPAPIISIGQDINLNNGQVNAALKVIQDCFDDGLVDWVIPIVECGKCNQSAEVVGFAEIRITGVFTTTSDKRVELGAICKVNDPGVSGSGGSDFGVKSIAMVQ